ncbi:hypothetical protein BJY52DRAFT_1293440, partial [Lactarius psammicola]
MPRGSSALAALCVLILIHIPYRTYALRKRLQSGRTRDKHKGAVSTITDLRRVTGELASETAHISARTDDFAMAVPTFRKALTGTFCVSADAAVSSVVEFGNDLLHLSTGRTTIAHTRGLALRAQREFRTIYKRIRKALVVATDLCVEITYWRA